MFLNKIVSKVSIIFISLFSYNVYSYSGEIYTDFSFGTTELSKNDYTFSNYAILPGIGYRITDLLSVNLGYQYVNFDKNRKEDSFGLLQQALINFEYRYKLFENVHPYIKVGASMWKGDNKFIKHRGLSPTLSLGWIYEISDNVDIKTEYLTYLNDGLNDGELNTFLVGIRYNFGSNDKLDIARTSINKKEIPVIETTSNIIHIKNNKKISAFFKHGSTSIINMDLVSEELINVDKKNITCINLVGYTDNTGTAKYNYKFGLKRADIVKKYLVALGFPKSKIKVSSNGEYHPFSSNDTRAGRANNRRATIYIEFESE